MMELLLVTITQTSHDWCPGIHHQLWLAPQDTSQSTISHDRSIIQLPHPPLLLTTPHDYHPWTTANFPTHRQLQFALHWPPRIFIVHHQNYNSLCQFFSSTCFSKQTIYFHMYFVTIHSTATITINSFMTQITII